MTLTTRPLGPYTLAEQNRYFGGWTAAGPDGDAIAMAFPVEGWTDSAAVVVRQQPDGTITGSVVGGGGERAWRQAMAVLSLDVDGSGYAAVGERDAVIGGLQRHSAFLRPVLFHSPYEAACGFIIGHRLRMAQGRALRRRIAEEHGTAIDVGGAAVHAFPGPRRLLDVAYVPGLNALKIERLHAAAEAALSGLLDRERLRALPLDAAVASVRSLPGIGPFFAQGVVLRGAGIVDAVPGDDITVAGIARFYGLEGPVSGAALDAITDRWRPYRMWCSVLVHASERRARDGWPGTRPWRRRTPVSAPPGFRACRRSVLAPCSRSGTAPAGA